jgi:hypothetical protein
LNKDEMAASSAEAMQFNNAKKKKEITDEFM